MEIRRNIPQVQNFVKSEVKEKNVKSEVKEMQGGNTTVRPVDVSYTQGNDNNNGNTNGNNGTNNSGEDRDVNIKLDSVELEYVNAEIVDDIYLLKQQIEHDRELYGL